MIDHGRNKGICLGLFITFAASTSLFQACAPAPRHLLTQDEKRADLSWLHSKFKTDYAPLEYKEKTLGFSFEDRYAQAIKDADAAKSNDEFYSILYRLVGGFRDAHTSGSLMNADVPGRAKIAYLGFAGKRKGDVYLVDELLPTIDTTATHFPILSGDKITEVDGVAIKKYALDHLAKFRDLGQDESNATYHMARMFSRYETAGGLPEADSVILTVLRDDKTYHYTLPWVIKELRIFNSEQAAAKKKPDPASVFSGALGAAAKSIFDGKTAFIPNFVLRISAGTSTFNPFSGFEFLDTMPNWQSPFLKKSLLEVAQKIDASGVKAADDAQTPLEELKAKRKVPDHVFFVSEAVTFPTYVTNEPILDADGKATEASKLIGYMYLNSFSPGGEEKDVIKEVGATIKTLQKNGVNDLVIDLINNGGGSLILGTKLATLLSKDKIEVPGMQFMLNETWLDEFQNASISGSSDAEMARAGRVFENLKEDWDIKKLRISRKVTAEELSPFDFEGNTDLKKNMHVVLLVNEMCVSMCDIFTGIIKDNALGTVVGAKTMGGGGNIVNIGQAPNSHFGLTLTESLVVRKDGSYIENNGIVPDVAMDVSDSVDSKYEDVRVKAIKLLTTAAK